MALQKQNVNIPSKTIHNWFKGQGFKQVVFENGKTYISSYWNGNLTSVKLKEKVGFRTFYKEAYGSAIIVYDISVSENTLTYEGYCPIWLFGIWNKKISFKKNTKGIFKYRREGYFIEEKFQKFLENKTSN